MTLIHARQLTAPAAHPGVTARVRGWLRAAVARLAWRSRTSAAKAAGAPVGHAERVLCMDRGPGGSLVVATRVAVYCQNTAGPARAWSRLGWEEVGGIAWNDQRRVLTLTGVGPGGAWRKELALPSRTVLVELARERFTATLLASTAVRVGGQVCAWVTARRQPASGKVVWVVVLNSAADAANPAIPATVAAVIADLQAETGIPAVDAGGATWPAHAARSPATMPGGPTGGTVGYRPRRLPCGHGWMWPGPSQRRSCCGATPLLGRARAG